MGLNVYLLLLVPVLSGPADAPLPDLVRLKQDAPRSVAKLTLPRPHVVGPTIPGLKQGAVPQGLAFWETQRWWLISCFFEDARPSVIVALDQKTQKLVRCLTLVEPDGEAHVGHVGGLALSNKYLWVVMSVKGDQKAVPAVVLCVRQKVQGLAFMDGHVILSVSYGRKDDSTLAVYANPLRGEKVKPHTVVKVQGEQRVPLWFLDGKNRVKEIQYPPMSEGITPYGKQLGVICESGAAKYQKRGRGGLDSIIFLTPLAQD